VVTHSRPATVLSKTIGPVKREERNTYTGRKREQREKKRKRKNVKVKVELVLVHHVTKTMWEWR
jgi:hypothetical protein